MHECVCKNQTEITYRYVFCCFGVVRPTFFRLAIYTNKTKYVRKGQKENNNNKKRVYNDVFVLKLLWFSLHLLFWSVYWNISLQEGSFWFRPLCLNYCIVATSFYLTYYKSDINLIYSQSFTHTLSISYLNSELWFWYETLLIYENMFSFVHKTHFFIG